MIKNIIFDLGGVLYDIDFSRSVRALSSHGVSLTEQDWSHGNTGDLLDRFEKGLISTKVFLNSIRQQAHRHVTLVQVHEACCALLVGFRTERIELLQSLKQRYNLFLLSNTNEMHIKQVNEELSRDFSVGNLQQLFTHAYYSYDLQMRKPDVAIFYHVLEEQGLLAGETLFIDDSSLNTQAAASCGLQVLHKPAEVELCSALPAMLGAVC